MNIDWHDSLKAFAEANPDLPQGPDSIPEDEQPSSSKQPRLDVGIERKGRNGKTATLIMGWVCPDSELKEIAARLKTKLGTGGSARGGDILIQGDRRDDVVRLLSEMGYKSRKV